MNILKLKNYCYKLHFNFCEIISFHFICRKDGSKRQEQPPEVLI